MKKIVIFGAGGHAHVIADIIRAEGNTVVAFLDDNSSQQDCSGPISSYSNYKDCEFVIGIGSNSVREKLSSLKVKWHTVVHPTAVISASAIIGEGTVIMPMSVVNARSIVGKHCIVNTGAIIDHDNKIGDYTHISVGVKLGGTVEVGSNVFIGIGSSVKNNVTINNDIIIGAGAAVIRDLLESGTYVGVPAHILEGN